MTDPAPIDYLKPDPKYFPGQNFALISVVSPDSNQKNKACAVKIKGVFESIEIAKMEAKKLIDSDPTFDIMLAEVGKWLPIPPDKDLIENQEYQDSFLNDLMQGHMENSKQGDRMFQDRKEDLVTGKVDPSSNK